MATGPMSSLGLGSGVLTYDVIDQLRKADEESLIKPILTKQEKNTEKQTELALLLSSLGGMRSLTSKFSDTSTYLARKTSITGDGVTATAAVGLLTQSIKVQVERLAKNDIHEVGYNYSSKESSFSTYNVNLAMNKGGNSDIGFIVGANRQLQDVSQDITDKTSGDVAGVILNTGGTNPYQLMINSKNTGHENKVYMGTTLKSGSVYGGDLGTGDITINFRDSSGVDKSITVSVGASDSTTTSTANSNTEMILEKIQDALDAADSNIRFKDSSSSYDSATRNRPLRVDLGTDGKSIIFNDFRGNEIGVEVSGFSQDTGLLGGKSSKSAHEMSVIETGTIASGALSGTFTIGSATISISTSSSNTRKQNAESIISTLNTTDTTSNLYSYMAGFTAELNSNNDGFNIVKRVTTDSSAAAAIGIEGGLLDNYIKGSKAVSAGNLTGTIKLGTQEIDLDAITDSTSTSAQNAAAIATAISEINGFSATSNSSSGVITINSSQRTFGILADTSNTSASNNLLSNLNIKTGANKTYGDFFGFSYDGGSELDNIQPGQDSKIYYNDIAISRSGNRIDDILSGLTIELSETHNLSANKSATVTIKQDMGAIVDDIKEFVKQYNELATKLAELTKYDPDTGISGVFQGDSQIYGIKGKLNNLLSFSDGEGNSLINYGLYLGEDGALNIDEDKLNKMVFEDTKATEKFFRGYISTVDGQDVESDGIFTKFTDTLDALVTGSSSTLKSYETRLEDELKKYEQDRLSMVKLIDSRYEIMASRFAAYDTMIAGINSSFQSLQMQINQMMG